MSSMILAADVGGTKTAVGLFVPDKSGLQVVAERTFQNAEYTSMEAVLGAFRALAPQAPPDVACLGVAGPVRNGRCQVTNLPWRIEENQLAANLRVRRVKLLNDLEATALGTPHLEPTDLARLDDAGAPGDGNVGVIAAGTGLGEAMLYWDGARYHPLASEGGHADFAPRTEREVELLRYLWRKLGPHASYERVLSGPGLHLIYNFLREGGPPEPTWLTREMLHEDPSMVIAQNAIAAGDPVCAQALETFCSIYGAEAGNLALKCLAVGGVFVAGGIAGKILPALRQGTFMAAFTDKGRFAPFMRSLRVHVVLSPRTALLGAAHFALTL
jgi:glucokinase